MTCDAMSRAEPTSAQGANRKRAASNVCTDCSMILFHSGRAQRGVRQREVARMSEVYAGSEVPFLGTSLLDPRTKPTDVMRNVSRLSEYSIDTSQDSLPTGALRTRVQLGWILATRCVCYLHS